MNIRSEKLLLRSIAAGYSGQRNIGNFSKSEREDLQALRIQGKVCAYIDERNWHWARLTSTGLKRLYELNGRQDV